MRRCGESCARVRGGGAGEEKEGLNTRRRRVTLLSRRTHLSSFGDSVLAAAKKHAPNAISDTSYEYE